MSSRQVVSNFAIGTLVSRLDNTGQLAATSFEEQAMKDVPKFEIPEAMREVAERNVEQARGAYEQFVEMTRKAQDTAAKSSEVVTDGARELQSRTLRFAQEHVDASFALASDLARAKDLKDYFDIQARYAQQQMTAYSAQAQELGRLMGDMAQKNQRK